MVAMIVGYQQRAFEEVAIGQTFYLKSFIGLWRSGQQLTIIDKQLPAIRFIFSDAPADLIRAAMNCDFHFKRSINCCLLIIHLS